MYYYKVAFMFITLYNNQSEVAEAFQYLLRLISRLLTLFYLSYFLHYIIIRLSCFIVK